MRLLTLQMSNFGHQAAAGRSESAILGIGNVAAGSVAGELFPHMHLRGSGFEYQLPAPGGPGGDAAEGGSLRLLLAAVYQLKTPRRLAAGTRLLWTGIFDNSANNPRNPDPKAEVTWGDQSWEEMMVGFFDVAVPPGWTRKLFHPAVDHSATLTETSDPGRAHPTSIG